MTRMRFLIFLLCLCSLGFPARAASRLEFPLLALEAGQIMGVALVNPNSDEAEVLLTLFAADGTVLATQSVFIAAGRQLSFLASEVFTGVDLSQVGWFRAESASNDLTGFFLYLNSLTGDLHGADLPVPARHLFFAQIEGDGIVSTQINLVNPGLVAARVTAHLRVGTLTQRRIFTIARRGAIQFDPEAFFGGNHISPAGELEITSDEDLLGFQILRHRDGDSIGLNARSSGHLLNRLYFPQIVLGGGVTNSLAVKNQSRQSVAIQVAAHTPNGELMALGSNPVTMEIEGGEVYRTSLATLLGFEGEEQLTGWLKVAAPREVITGEIVYRIDDGGAAAAVPAAESGSQRLLFSHLATVDDFFTGLALLNPGRFPAALRGVSVSRSGEQLGRFDLVLAPRQRVARLITELIPEAANQSGGFIWIEADGPVFATGLFGNGEVTLLANVPPQSYPDRFRADSDFPVRPKVTPSHATAAPGDAAQFAGPEGSEWRVDGIGGGTPDVGTIDSTGLYSAPSSISTTPAGIEAATDSGVAAAAVDLLTSEDILSREGPVAGIATFPLSGRTFFSAGSAAPGLAGGEEEHQLFELVAGAAEVQTSLGFIPSSMTGFGEAGAEKLFLAATDEGGGYIYDPATNSLTDLQLGPVSAAAFDPISGGLLVAQEGILRGIDATERAGLELATTPTSRFTLSGASDPITSLAIDRCNSDIWFTTTSGILGRFRRAQADLETVREDLPANSKLLANYRDGISCPKGTEILLLEEARVALLEPTSGNIFSPWSGLTQVSDLALDGNGRILALRQSDEAFIISAIDNGAVYNPRPINPPQLELAPIRSTAPGLDLELISTTASSGQSVTFNLLLRVPETPPASMVFSIDIDSSALIFDDTDTNGDGLPDAVLSLLPNGYTLFSSYDPEDEDGELDFIIADLDLDAASLGDGNILSISFQVAIGFEGTSDLLVGTGPGPSAADQNAVSLVFDETLTGSVTVGRVR